LRPALALLLFSLLFTTATQAKEIRYVSDKIFIVLHKGPGTSYKWVARLTPGTRLTQARLSDDGKWAEVTTDRGTIGWVQEKDLGTDIPAQVKLPAALKKAEGLAAENATLSAELAAVTSQKDELLSQINTNSSELGDVSGQLSQLKQISGNAVQLDIDNRRLVEESEHLRSEVEMLKSESQRLQDKLESEDFLNGALAVLLGVIIALVAPRLVPKRRKSSSWA
jgi:SH3 domain protein